MVIGTVYKCSSDWLIINKHHEPPNRVWGDLGLRHSLFGVPYSA